MRHVHDIPTACPANTKGRISRADGFVPLRVAAARLGMTMAAVRVWAHRGVLACDQSRNGAKLWIKLTDDDVQRASGTADTCRMERVRDVARRCGTSISDVWERVRRGEFEAYRAPRGRGQWEWWLSPRPSHSVSERARLLSLERKDA